jgi:hypothetical protein
VYFYFILRVQSQGGLLVVILELLEARSRVQSFIVTSCSETSHKFLGRWFGCVWLSCRKIHQA